VIEDYFTNTEADAGRYEAERARDEWDDRPTRAEAEADEACVCPWTDPSTWFTYYGATEPGGQREWDPDCPVHPGNNRAAS